MKASPGRRPAITHLPAACVVAASLFVGCSRQQEPSGASVAGTYLTNDHFSKAINKVIMEVAGKSPDYGTNHTVTLTRVDLAGKPKWNVGESEPPISASKALLDSIGLMKRTFAGREDLTWKIQSMELMPLDVQEGLWVWRVNTEVTVQKRTDKLPIVIDMGGEVLTKLNTVKFTNPPSRASTAEKNREELPPKEDEADAEGGVLESK